MIGGTTAVLGATGLALGTQEAGAQADVSLGELAIEPAELAPSDGEVYIPWLLLSGEYRYTVETTPAKWQVYVLVGDGAGNTSAVGLTEGDTTAKSASGSYAVRGAITAADFWTPSDFAVASDGSPTTVSVPVEIVLVIRDADNAMLIQSSVTDIAEVTVTQGGPSARLAGTGTVAMQDDSGGATPALPEE